MSSRDQPVGPDEPAPVHPGAPFHPADQSAPTTPAAPITPGRPGYEPVSYVWPSEVEPPRPPDPAGLSQTAMAAAVTAVIGVLGLAVGWLWYHVAPRIEIAKVAGGYVYASAEPEQGIAADGWFLIIGIALGLVLGIIAWLLLPRFRGVGMLIALTLGSVLGAWAAWWLGYRLAHHDFTAAAAKAVVGTHLNAPLELGISNMDPHRMWFPGFTGMIVAQALAAALVYTALAGISAHDNLRPPRKSLAETATPPAPSAPPAS